MISPSLEALVDLAREHGACSDALTRVRECGTLEAASKHRRSVEWAQWLLIHVRDLPQDIRKAAVLKVVGDPVLAAELLRDMAMRPYKTAWYSEEALLDLVDAVLADPDLSAGLWRDAQIPGALLPKGTREKALASACGGPNTACAVLVSGLYLEPEERRVAMETVCSHWVAAARALLYAPGLSEGEKGQLAETVKTDKSRVPWFLACNYADQARRDAFMKLVCDE